MGNSRSKIIFRLRTRRKATSIERKAKLQDCDVESPYEDVEPLGQYGCAMCSREIHSGDQSMRNASDGQSDVGMPDQPLYATLNRPLDENIYSEIDDNDSFFEPFSNTTYATCLMVKGASNLKSINSHKTFRSTKSVASQDIEFYQDDSDDENQKEKVNVPATYEYKRAAECKIAEVHQQEQLSNEGQELQESPCLNESTTIKDLKSPPELTHIEVDEHNFNLFGDLIKSCPPIQRLCIRGIKEAASMPETIISLEALQELVFIECNFVDTSEFTESATHVLEQNIRGELQTPPPIITDLTTLRMLSMKGCQFEALPSDIGELCQLEVLDISFNKYLDKLPVSMEYMFKLAELRLCHCAFEEVPAIIGQLTSLQTIDLSNNHLHSYPHVTLRLKQLTCLDLSNTPGEAGGKNNIEQIPVQVIDTALKSLNIACNPVVIPPVEVCEKGFAAIRDYLSNVRSGNSLHADTIIVVGEPKAGKSSVAKSLVVKRSRQATKKGCSQVLDQLSIAVDHQRLVNLNDFGGDEVSTEIIPYLSPAEGLVLIVYDMSKEPRSEYEKAEGVGSLEDVQKWLTAWLTWCPRARVIVVGTHKDAVEKHKWRSFERLMKKHVRHVLQSVESDILKQKTSLEVCSSTTIVKQNIEKLNKRLEAVKEADVNVVAMSCFQETDSGIERLMRAISNKLEPIKPLPDSVFCIISEILSNKNEDLLFLKWEQIETIYERPVPDAENDLAKDRKEKIENALRYLRNTSQIIWVEDHGINKRLSRYVFHQPALIAKICESVLRLDWITENYDCLEIMSQNCLKKSRDGYLRESDLHFHWRKSFPFLCRQPSDTLKILVELMMHFHIIIEVAEEPCGRLFVNPRYFATDPPAEQLALIERPFMPRIHIKLKFIGSSAHGAHFAENLVAILAWAHSRNVLPVVWTNGVFFKVEGVYFLATQDRGVMDLIASVDSEKDDMWSVLIFIIQYLNHTVFAARSDTPHDVTVECPGCRCCGRHSPTAGCTERGRTTLGSLSRPLDQCTTVWRFCPDCKKDVPTCLVYPCYLEKYTHENQEAVAKFFADLRHNCEYFSESISTNATNYTEVKHCCSESEAKSIAAAEEVFEYLAPKPAQPTDLVRKVRAFRPSLIDVLTIEDVRYIVDELYSKLFISKGQKEQIEAGADNGNRLTAVRRLLDAIENRGHEAVTTLIGVLQSEKIDRRDLVDLLLSVQAPS